MLLLAPWMGFLVSASVNLLSPLSVDSLGNLQALCLSMYTCKQLKALYIHKALEAEKPYGRPACSSYIHEEDANSDSWIDSKERHKAMMQGKSVVDLNWGEPVFHFNF
jgi:hypothetical protein